jgi:hypothetical protein
MPRTHLSLERVRQELAWVDEPVDRPDVCGCRHHLCCECSGHAPANYSRPVDTKLWTYHWEYFCGACREYQFGGKSAPRYMATP